MPTNLIPGPRDLSHAPSDDVAAFLANHGTPYDSDTDTYQRDPLVLQGRHSKSSAIYNAHAYHTKVPPDAIRPYIEHYTSPGDLVLDPFCGSGMTGVAALLAGRNAIISDLSPAAVHIAYNYCTPISSEVLRRAWDIIKQDVADEFRWLYETTCDRCHGPATIQYTVWSDVVACKTCEGDVVLWDVAVVRRDDSQGLDPPLSGLTQDCTPVTLDRAPLKNGAERSAGDVLEEFSCPHCNARLKKTQCTYRRTEPVLTSYECNGNCRPKRQERATTAAERDRIREIAAKEPPYWVPDTLFDPTREMWRGVHRDQGIARVRDFWTPRNLWALASLWSRVSAVEDERLARALRFVVTSTMWLSAKLYRYRVGGGGGEQGKLWVSSLTRENNVALLSDGKLKDMASAFAQLKIRGSAVASVQSATHLSAPDCSIDDVFTDPPFGSNLFYSDLSLLWEVWLGDLTDEAQEAVWNRSKGEDEGGKSLDDYRELMEQSLAEIYRLLKPGRWATVVFSNSDDRVWHAIQVAAQKAGFAIAAAGSLDKMQRSYKGVRGDKGEEKVVTKDVVINLLKPVVGATIHVSALVDDPEELVRSKLTVYLADLATSASTDLTQRRTQALYDHVVTSLLGEGIPTVGFGLAFVQSVAQDSFKQVDGQWYRRGDRVLSGRLGLDVVDEASAILWLDNRLSVQPATEAELIPEFNTVSTARISGGLERLLRENFRLDPLTKRWRVPTTLEREALNDAGADQRRRRVKRASEGAYSELTNTELVELAEEAIRQAMYAEAQALADRVHRPDLPSDERDRIAMVKMAAGAALEA